MVEILTKTQGTSSNKIGNLATFFHILFRVSARQSTKGSKTVNKVFKDTANAEI